MMEDPASYHPQPGELWKLRPFDTGLALRNWVIFTRADPNWKESDGFTKSRRKFLTLEPGSCQIIMIISHDGYGEFPNEHNFSVLINEKVWEKNGITLNEWNQIFERIQL